MITEAVGPTPEQKAQWEEEGYIVLENALRGAQLQRLQAAFDKAVIECKEDWLARVARGETMPTCFDIPRPLERDEIFVDIVDHPSWFGLYKILLMEKHSFWVRRYAAFQYGPLVTRVGMRTCQ